MTATTCHDAEEAGRLSSEKTHGWEHQEHTGTTQPPHLLTPVAGVSNTELGMR